MNTDLRGKAAARGRRKENDTLRRLTEVRLREASRTIDLWQQKPSLDFLIGLLMKASSMDKDEVALLAALGAAEIARLTEDLDDPQGQRPTAAVVSDIHVEFPGIPSDELAEALTGRAFACYSDKRLKDNKPRVWQGSGYIHEIQKLVGSAGVVYIKAPSAPSLDAAPIVLPAQRASKASIDAEASVLEDDVKTIVSIADPAEDAPSTELSSDCRPVEDDRSLAPMSKSASEDPEEPRSELRYSDPSNVGVRYHSVNP